jgi:serine/threonine protein kinase
MSPEQARGEGVDLRTDIWGFGVVLYETIAGSLPFRGDYANAVVYAILNEQPEPLTAVRTGVLSTRPYYLVEKRLWGIRAEGSRWFLSPAGTGSC